MLNVDFYQLLKILNFFLSKLRNIILNTNGHKYRLYFSRYILIDYTKWDKENNQRQ